MKSAAFKGVTVAHITPFNNVGAIDIPSLRKLIDRQIEHGTDVILAAGSTGESATLSQSELSQLFEIVIGQVRSRVPVVCGAGTNATHKTIDLVKIAEKAGADAILSVSPYYNKPTQEGIYQHFKTVAESTGLPIIIYNVPGRTGSNISAATTLRLAEIDNIIGIKEASGNLSQIMEIILNRPHDFLVLSGDDAITLPILALGGDGVISVIANETPDLFKKMITYAFNGNWDEARNIHYQLLPLMEANFIESNPIPVKTVMAMMGLVEENFRLPLVQMSDVNKERLRTVLKSLNL